MYLYFSEPLLVSDFDDAKNKEGFSRRPLRFSSSAKVDREKTNNGDRQRDECRHLRAASEEEDKTGGLFRAQSLSRPPLPNEATQMENRVRVEDGANEAGREAATLKEQNGSLNPQRVGEIFESDNIDASAVIRS